jgi:hypothetical protein
MTRALRTEPAAFTLTLDEYEANDPPKGDYLAFRANVVCDGFSGHTDFWVARGDFAEFAAALESVDRTLAGEAELVCGWGANEHIRLRIAPFDGSGRQLAEVSLASPAGGAGEEVRQFVSTRLVTLPTSVTTFRSGIQRFLDQRLIGTIQLVGDPEAMT